MDSLGIERASFWGHSDGAVIAAILGFTAPERVNGLVLEAFHYYRLKPSSRQFFETLAYQPDALGAELCERFAHELGADYWRHLIATHARAWLQMAQESIGPGDDLYGGRLREITAPTLFIHGRLDPRTEPGELHEVRSQLPHAEMHILDNATHSPHSENAVAHLVTDIASRFLSDSTR
jgi:pimeloyl-ACP methyl ester carboxylesterase